jgi:hypothetical protein
MPDALSLCMIVRNEECNLARCLDSDGNERTSVEVVAGKVRFLGRGNNNGDEKRSTPGQPTANAERFALPPATSAYSPPKSAACPF